MDVNVADLGKNCFKYKNRSLLLQILYNKEKKNEKKIINNTYK